MKAFFLAALFCLGAGCGPKNLVLPSAAAVPMLRHQDHMQVGGKYGSEGFQIDSGYAVTDSFMLRAMGQADSRGDGYFRLASGGLGFFFGAEPDADRPWRWAGAIGADIGAASARGAETIDLGTTQPKMYYMGSAVRTALQGDLGIHSRYLEAVLTTRLVFFHFTHNADSSFVAGTAEAIFVEPILVLRGGLRDLKLEFQGGYSWRATSSGALGGHSPWIVSGGFSGDF